MEQSLTDWWAANEVQFHRWLREQIGDGQVEDADPALVDHLVGAAKAYLALNDDPGHRMETARTSLEICRRVIQ